jgi:hypothetical protein
MALQKKVNKMQVEHVSEEEVDQLFYALEVHARCKRVSRWPWHPRSRALSTVVLTCSLCSCMPSQLKEQQLAEETQKNKHLEEEVLTARQLSARGGQVAPQVVEIHHHNDLSDEEDDEGVCQALRTTGCDRPACFERGT